MKNLICAVDLGSTNIKAGLVTERGFIETLVVQPVAEAILPDGMSIEAGLYARLAMTAIRGAVCPPEVAESHIHALAITNQRATILPVDANENPIAPALSWQDDRGTEMLETLHNRIDHLQYSAITGLPSSTIWSLSKLLWWKTYAPETFTRARYFVTLHEYMLRLLGAPRYITDPSNASLTGLYDIRRGNWSAEILTAVDIASSHLPQIATAGFVAGALSDAAAEATGLPPNIPLIVGGGDQQCAALGVGALHAGQVTVCLGTAAVVNCPVAQPPPPGDIPRLACSAHVLPNTWFLEGLHGSFGSSLRMVADIIGVGEVAELESLAAQAPPGAHDLLFLPFITGIASPDFDNVTRGAFLGMDIAQNKSDFARASLEGNCLELRRILQTIAEDAPIKQLLLVCGGAKTGLLGQLLADITGHSYVVPAVAETTLMGAAILAWLGCGRFSSAEQGAKEFSAPASRVLIPALSEAIREELYQRYIYWVQVLRKASRP